jgi:hypothetical protein
MVAHERLLFGDVRQASADLWCAAGDLRSGHSERSHLLCLASWLYPRHR